MTAHSEFNTYGTDLEQFLCLRTYPIAIKMLESESEVPEGAVRPKKDRDEHYAVCQAFALARRQGMTIAMFLEDHWCFEPIISYGLVETPQDYLEGSTSSFFIADKQAAEEHSRQMTRLPVGQYPGMVMGPLKSANFEPDLVMIYCNSAQLRHLLLALRYLHGTQVTSTLDPIGSCVHSVVPSLLNGECQVTVPDPGDFERAGAQEDEMVLTVPRNRLEGADGRALSLSKSQEGDSGASTFRSSPTSSSPPSTRNTSGNGAWKRARARKAAEERSPGRIETRPPQTKIWGGRFVLVAGGPARDSRRW